MGRKKAISAPDDNSLGAIVTHNLARLGWAETVTKYSDVARAIEAKTGRKMSRQRVAAILAARNVTPESLELLAKGVGVSVKELTKPKGKEPR